MKIYIASSFDLKSEVESLEQWLIKRGHEITCHWWHKDYKLEDEHVVQQHWYSNPMLKAIYSSSIKAIERSDAVILLCPPDMARKFNGANVEVGYALAKGIPVISFGQIEKSGMYEPLIRVGNDSAKLEQALLELER